MNPIEDTYRIDYHRAHIEAMKAAMFEDGAEVMGYLGWGLIDILSSRATCVSATAWSTSTVKTTTLKT